MKGSTIQTVNAFKDIGAGLKTLVGGELTKYNDMMNKARALATKRMVEEASQPGREREACRLHLRGLRYKVHFLQQKLVVLLQGLLLCVKTQIMRLIPGGVMPLFSLPKGHLASDKETA